jgi:hypothetical protein
MERNLKLPHPLRPRSSVPAEADWIARERLTAKRSRREMARQRLEKIKSGPGNGMVSKASDPQHVVHGARLTARDSG